MICPCLTTFCSATDLDLYEADDDKTKREQMAESLDQSGIALSHFKLIQTSGGKTAYFCLERIYALQSYICDLKQTLVAYGFNNMQ